MAYVRKHGGQLAIVSGERNKEKGNKVVQRTLFSFYSKDEALAAIGENTDNEASFFKHLMEKTYPTVSFDWKKITGKIKSEIDHLPDTYENQEENRNKEFKDSIIDFAKRLVLLDPYRTKDAKPILENNRESLEALRDLIDKCISRHDFARDNDYDPPIEQYDKFKWRFALRGSYIPDDIEEWAEGLFHKQEYDRAKAIFELLVEASDNYAEGHNYLGLIALDLMEIDDAIKHFENTVKTGRHLFPKSMPKSNYWLDLDTRPYIRGLMNLALALNMAGRYKESIVISKRLKIECGESDTADSHMATSYLSLGDYKKSAKIALKQVEHFPSEGFVASFALLELEEEENALENFIHASIDSSHAARIFLNMKKPKPTDSTTAEDHNSGIFQYREHYAYFQNRSQKSNRFFKNLAKNKVFLSLLDYIDSLSISKRQDDESWSRYIKEMNAMRSKEFAAKKAREILKEMSKPKLKRVK